MLSFVRNRRIKNVSHWSAPAVMSTFLLICIIVIYSFESFGLTNREKNLESRRENIVISHIKIEKEIESPKEKIVKFRVDDLISSTKVQKLDMMHRILIEGTENQMKYEGNDIESLEYYDNYN